jgi:hypothetical protein
VRAAVEEKAAAVATQQAAAAAADAAEIVANAAEGAQQLRASGCVARVSPLAHASSRFIG